MVEMIRGLCLTLALICFFFASYYTFSGQVSAGVWAGLSGILLMFIREFLVFDEED